MTMTLDLHSHARLFSWESLRERLAQPFLTIIAMSARATTNTAKPGKDNEDAAGTTGATSGELSVMMASSFSSSSPSATSEHQHIRAFLK